MPFFAKRLSCPVSGQRVQFLAINIESRNFIQFARLNELQRLCRCGLATVLYGIRAKMVTWGVEYNLDKARRRDVLLLFYYVPHYAMLAQAVYISLISRVVSDKISSIEIRLKQSIHECRSVAGNWRSMRKS